MPWSAPLGISGAHHCENVNVTFWSEPLPPPPPVQPLNARAAAAATAVALSAQRTRRRGNRASLLMILPSLEDLLFYSAFCSYLHVIPLEIAWSSEKMQTVTNS
ncbi:hypothetical protein [Leifsonia shinshuensis]|uniref:Uncharacterized protein n=1 Tax=Leifsonia shinshuensis TaxID=150026 RepID=A0A853CY58_9MICO|nr:hypothetical protein [Leifsonia shinshuensis]NYJ25482.1 hypothetical protein [Leifsonia shinshuensis]